MNDIMWDPVELETGLCLFGDKSSIFFHQDFGKDLVLIHEGNITLLITFSIVENKLICECIKIIHCANDVLQITGNNNCIIMINIMQELFYLKITTKNETAALTSFNVNELFNKEAVLSWHKLHQLSNFMAFVGMVSYFLSFYKDPHMVTTLGLKNTLAFLYHNEYIYAALYNSNEIEVGLSEFSVEKLNYYDSFKNFHLIKLRGEFANIISCNILNLFTSTNESNDEVLLIVQPSHLLFSKCNSHGQILSQPYDVFFERDHIINIIIFDKKYIILIVCKSGKISCLRYKDSLKTFELNDIWLPQKVYAILGYEENDIICLLWSDLNYLNFSKIDNMIELVHIQLTYNIRGVRHFQKIGNNILAVTRNACFYKTKINDINGNKTSMLPYEILRKINKIGRKIESLNEEINGKEDMIDALEKSSSEEISSKISVINKGDSIVIENNSEFTFKKKLWCLSLEVKDNMQKLVELKKFDNDFLPGSSVILKWSGINPQKLEVNLICNLMNKGVILIKLKVNNEDSVNKLQDPTLNELEQYLEKNFNFHA